MSAPDPLGPTPLVAACVVAATFGACSGLPAHLNCKTLALDPDGPKGPLFWRSRAQDTHVILDGTS